MKHLLLLTVLTVFCITPCVSQDDWRDYRDVPDPPCETIWKAGHYQWRVWGGIPYPVYIEGEFVCITNSSDTGGDPGDEGEGGPVTTKG